MYNKKIVSLALICATTSLMALQSEHAYLYKDPRIMGMGGANVAVGSYSTSVFSNPAGLVNIKKDHGVVVDLLGLGVSSTSQVQELIDDIDTAETDADTVDVLSEYNGEHFHIGVDNYTSVSKNSDVFAWTIGLLAASDINLMPHSNGSTTGSLLETSSRVYGGVVLGAAKEYSTEYGRVDVGMSLKYITMQSYEGTLGISDLTGDDVNDAMQEKFEKKASGVGVDIGANYHIFEGSQWHPVIGISVLNIGSMSMDDYYGGQPMTVNMGVSVTPEVSLIDKLVIALDYVDIFNENYTRLYDYNSVNNSVTYSDYEEADLIKRVRFGVGLGLVDTTFLSTTLNLGLYQGAYTAGIDMQLALLKLNVATYEEQLGTGSVDIADRRYMAQIGIGW